MLLGICSVRSAVLKLEQSYAAVVAWLQMKCSFCTQPANAAQADSYSIYCSSYTGFPSRAEFEHPTQVFTPNS